ncbi:MAG: M48 family metalloprotease [Gammaproteobacteria bacterium]|nr:M48 family metalloprotease [Gammaproteobacteria bacterium]
MASLQTIDTSVWVQHAWRNRLQSLLLLVIMAGFVILLGQLLWGADGMLILLVVGLFGVLFSPSFSPWMIMRMYGASRLTPEQSPALWRLVATLGERAGLSAQPELYYVPSRMLNAFAVGSKTNAAIGITDGLLRQLDQRELAGVLAHEISHIRSNDLWVMGLADLFSRATSILSLMGQFLLLVNLPLILFTQVSISWFAIALLIFAPHFSALAQLALSRTREFDADLNAARLTGDPEGLARALAKIEQVQGGWLERVFLPGRRVPEPSLLRTHPHTEERIARLMALQPQLAESAMSMLQFSGAPKMQYAQYPISRMPRWHVNGLWF